MEGRKPNEVLSETLVLHVEEGFLPLADRLESFDSGESGASLGLAKFKELKFKYENYLNFIYSKYQIKFIIEKIIFF